MLGGELLFKQFDRKNSKDFEQKNANGVGTMLRGELLFRQFSFKNLKEKTVRILKEKSKGKKH